MTEMNKARVPGRGAVVAGWVLMCLPAALMVLSGVMKLVQPPEVMEGMSKLGWTSGRVTVLGVVELACAVLLLVPRTAGLGAILVTGYLGGATATHAQAGEVQFVVPVLLGMMAWLGLYLRDPRVRALVPLRSVG